MITASANVLILNSTIAVTIDNIDVLSVSDSGGEIFRKAYQSKETISEKVRKYTFFLAELEVIATITKLSLYGNGATDTLGDGTEMAYQTVNITKTDTTSLLLYWTTEVK